MSDQNIKCPSCGFQIALTETLSKQMKEEMKSQMEGEYQKKKEELAKEKESIDSMIEGKMAIEKKNMWIKAQDAAKKMLGEEQELKVKELEEINKEREEKIKKFQDMELELRKKMRVAEEERKNQEIELQRKMDEERKNIEDNSRKQIEEENRLKVLEKDKQMEILKKTIEDLKRQSEQGSMQIQGEVQENEMKEVLKRHFSVDDIEDVPTGIRGADLVHKIKDTMGQECGIILWESKNTKAWDGKWIKKLKHDQGIAKADVCILISRSLPSEIEKGFGMIDGVWVCNYASAVSLAETLRFHLLEISKTKKSLVGREKKSEFLYEYLSGSQFKNRIENIVMAFKSLREDLETEKRSMNRLWSKREKEIERMMLGTTGLYGDLQGIIGGGLPTISSLELESGEEEEALF